MTLDKLQIPNQLLDTTTPKNLQFQSLFVQFSLHFSDTLVIILVHPQKYLELVLICNSDIKKNRPKVFHRSLLVLNLRNRILHHARMKLLKWWCEVVVFSKDTTRRCLDRHLDHHLHCHFDGRLDKKH